MRKRKALRNEQSEANLTPLLDIVFIMLIFFIVTATFTKEQGLPANSLASDDVGPTPSVEKNIQLAVTEDCWVVLDHQRISPEQVGARVQTLKAQRPDAPAIISVHQDARTKCVVETMDQVRRGGVFAISLRTQTETL